MRPIDLLKKLFMKSGLPSLLNRLYYKKHLTILTYHGVLEDELKIPDWCFVDSKMFHKQMLFIKRNFDVVKLSEGIRRLYQDDIYRPTLSVTFDDGFQNNFNVVFPIVKELQIPITIFLTSNYINTGKTLWFCRLNAALANTNKKVIEIDKKLLPLCSKEDKIQANRYLQQFLKSFPAINLDEKCSEVLAKLGSKCDIEFEIDSPYRMLDIPSIIRMDNSGLVEFGCHTHTHCILSKISEDNRKKEVITSKTSVESLITSKACRLFAYPNGGITDIPNCPEEILRPCEIEAAVTTMEGKNDKNISRWMLKRYGVGSWQPFNDFTLMVFGTKTYLNALLNRKHILSNVRKAKK